MKPAVATVLPARKAGQRHGTPMGRNYQKIQTGIATLSACEGGETAVQESVEARLSLKLQITFMFEDRSERTLAPSQATDGTVIFAGH